MNYVYEIYNDNISATISGKYINHKYFMNYNWRRNGSYYHTLGDVYMLYPYNLKKLFKGTKWQYSQIWEFAKHIDYFNVANFMESYSNGIEHLITAADAQTNKLHKETIALLFLFIIPPSSQQ